MKKIFFVFSVALLSLAACTRFEQETAPVFASSVAAPSITEVIAPGVNTDSTFTVKITPGAKNNYYSFAIIKGKADELDPETLLTLGYEGKCVTVKLIREEVEVDVPLSGCFKVSKQADTSVVAFDLVPNTEYTVYAVGNDEMGKLSKVEALTIKTTDQDAPSAIDAKGKYNVDDADLEEGTLRIKFDDDIELTDEFKANTAKFYAHYLSVNEVTEQDDLIEVFSAPVPVDSVSVDGKTVSIQVPERIPGAVVVITFDAKVVKNPVTLYNKAVSEYEAYLDEGDVVVKGFWGRFETAEWKFSLPTIRDEEGQEVRMPADTVIYVTDWESLMLEFVAQDLVEPQFQEGGPFNSIVPVKPSQIRYTDSKNRRVLNDAAEGFYGPLTDTTLVVMLAEAPDYGASISVDISEGDVEDIWGNPCAEFTTFYLDEYDEQFLGNYFLSYGYEVEDILGQYAYKGESAFGPDYNEEGIWVIEKSDNEEKGNVMITTLFDIPCRTPVYCSFNVDSGKLTIPDSVSFYDYDDPEHADKGVLMTAWDNADFGTLTMKEPGKLSNLDKIFGYYGKSSVSDKNSGWWNAFSEITAERTEEIPSSGETPAPAPSPRKARKAL